MKPLLILALVALAGPALAHDIGVPHAHVEGATGLWAGLVLILVAGTAALWRRR